MTENILWPIQAIQEVQEVSGIAGGMIGWTVDTVEIAARLKAVAG